MNHPFNQFFARRLIWKVTQNSAQTLAIWHEGHLIDERGQKVSEDPKARVALWHPLESPSETVLRWRTWLQDHDVTQPFKQAHRELYILTDAERDTGDYSNRFAAHILKQHQLNALCRTRGWNYGLQGDFDHGGFVPERKLPAGNLSVEFMTAVASGGEKSPAGIYLYTSTDAVRFRDDEGLPVRLENVPARLFSEAMRDVDLFVGVASIGNDPNWRPGFGYEYWQIFVDGPLNESAATRKDVLARLIPRLKIAAKCSLDGRYLRVQGSLRNYKIHLGSSNIMMEPNGAYLCIVPAATPEARAGTAFLPFEGDHTLSIIISKAFMLADDSKIKDPSIVSQIKGR